MYQENCIGLSDKAYLNMLLGEGAKELAEQAEEVRQIVTRTTSGWANAPEIVVVVSMQDPVVPQHLRDTDEWQKSQGAEGEPRGFFYKGRVYLVASQLYGDIEVNGVIAHEALGHYGLRGTFGRDFRSLLNQFALLRPLDIRRKAKQYGFDLSKESEWHLATEEALVDFAQEPELTMIRSTVAAMRTWIREHVPFLSRLPLSNDEIVRSFILPARRWVVAGPL